MDNRRTTLVLSSIGGLNLEEGTSIVLLLLRTYKPMRMDYLSILLEVFRSPREMFFCLKIMRSKSEVNHGALRAKSTNFKGLIFIPKTDKLLFWDLK